MFNTIFEKSIKEYKQNFRPIVKLMFVFYFLPVLLVFILSIAFYLSSGAINEINSFYMSSTLNKINLDKNLDFSGVVKTKLLFGNIAIMIFSLIASLVSMIATIGIAYSSLKDKKIEYQKATNYGKSIFFRFLLFYIVVGIFLLVLFILFIIPGIIFLVFWVFSFFIFIFERKEIIESLRGSYRLVKNRWWRTFGYIILFTLIVLLFSLVLSIPAALVNIIFYFSFAIGEFYLWLYLLNSFIGFISNSIIQVLLIPFGILFFKNLYLEYKKRK